MKNVLKKKDPNRDSPDPNRNALFASRSTPQSSSSRSSPGPDSRGSVSRGGNPYAPRQDSYNNDPYSSDPYTRDPYASRNYDQGPRYDQRRPSPAPRGYSSDSVDSNRNALFGNRPPPAQG